MVESLNSDLSIKSNTLSQVLHSITESLHSSGWFETYLISHPKDRSSQVEAKIMKTSTTHSLIKKRIVVFLYLQPSFYRKYMKIENTRWVSFDIKFTRQGFVNASWYCEACWAIQHAFSRPSLVNLISKDMNLVFYLSVYPLFHSSN